MMMQKSLSPAEAATALDVSREIVYRLLNRGELPAKRIGGQWRIHPVEFDAWRKSGNTSGAVAPSHKEGTCHTNEAAAETGGSLSKEYDKLLARQSTKTRKHSNTAST